MEWFWSHFARVVMQKVENNAVKRLFGQTEGDSGEVLQWTY